MRGRIRRDDGKIMQGNASALHEPRNVYCSGITIQAMLEALDGVGPLRRAFRTRPATRGIIITVEASQTCPGRRPEWPRLLSIRIRSSPGKREPVIRIIQTDRDFLNVRLRKIIVSERMGR